jgi:peptidoglycan/xylan/chitin deacetylase (PgdA/CDA1 family)
MYHRIAEAACDPWDLAVRPELFDEQLDLIRRRRTPMALDDLVAGLAAGEAPSDAIAVTFDDGYADNLHTGLKVLERHGVAATVFLATGMLGRPGEYWWDELARLILTSQSGTRLALDFAGRSIHVDIRERGDRRDLAWRAADPPETERQRAYHAVWRELRDLPFARVEIVMEEVRRATPGNAPDPLSRPMTPAEAVQLASSGLVRLGAHTMTHPALLSLEPEVRREEILGSRRQCEALVGRPVSGFSYPHGEFDAQTAAMVQEAGFAWACAGGLHVAATPGNDAFALPRVQALNWRAAGLARVLDDLSL